MKQREKITFIGLALFMGLFALYGQKLFMWGTKIISGGQFQIMLVVLPFALVVLIFFIVTSQRKLLSINAIILLGIYTIFLSLLQTKFVQVVHLKQSFIYLIAADFKGALTQFCCVIDSEGIDLFFHFFLAWISKCFAYGLKFGMKEFKKLWIVWLLIICVSEIVIQGRVNQRFVAPFDILNNMIGVTVALWLCLEKRKEKR